jgi:hypothetical protein
LRSRPVSVISVVRFASRIPSPRSRRQRPRRVHSSRRARAPSRRDSDPEPPPSRRRREVAA